MTAADRAKLIESVPIGAEQAAPSREVWRRLGMWSPTGVRHMLDELQSDGVIMRRTEPIPSGTRWVYWRGAA